MINLSRKHITVQPGFGDTIGDVLTYFGSFGCAAYIPGRLLNQIGGGLINANATENINNIGWRSFTPVNYPYLNDGASLRPQTFSLVAWVNWTGALTSSTIAWIISKGVGVGHNSYELSVSGNTIAASIRQATDNVYRYASSPSGSIQYYLKDKLCCLIATYNGNGGNVRLYANGKQIAISPASTYTTQFDTGKLAFGGIYGYAYPVLGKCSRMAVYNGRVFTASEIADYYAWSTGQSVTDRKYFTPEIMSGHPAMARWGGVPYMAVNKGVW